VAYFRSAGALEIRGKFTSAAMHTALPRWVMSGNPQNEQIFSAMPSKADPRLSPNVLAQSPPRRHWRLLSDDDPRSLSTLAHQRVELGAAHGDGAAVGERHGAARRIHGRDQVAFRG
jgi:hypothetical protein